MKKLIAFLLLLGGIWSCSQPKEDQESSTAAMPMPMEFAGTKYSDIAKVGIRNLANKDIDAFAESFDDNAVYRFNSGDSIVGKAAIHAYWKDRMANAIVKLEISKDIWLPIKVNESTNVRTGEWVLCWFSASATYTTGKSMNQWVHTVYHFNENDKIDEVTQFLDRAQIMAAMAEEKK